MEKDSIIKVMRKFFNRLKINHQLPKGEELELRITSEPGSASWHYDLYKGKTIHYITVSDKLFNASNEYSSKERMLESSLWHEYGHALFTTRDFKKLSEMLKTIEVPMLLWNLFEDIRMEHLLREKFKLKLNHIQYFKPEAFGYKHGTVDSLLLLCKGVEGSQFVTPNMIEEFVYNFIELNCEDDQVEDICSDIAYEQANRVINYYYKKIIECETSEDLIPLLQQWKEEFYNNQNNGKKSLEELLDQLRKLLCDENGKCDLEVTMELLEAVLQYCRENGNNPLDKSTKVISTVQEEKALMVNQNGKAELYTNIIDEFSDTRILDEIGDDKYDRDLARKLLPKFQKALESKVKKIATQSPSKRMHMRNIMHDKDKVYRKKEHNAKKAKELVLLIDCSGSMMNIIPKMNVLVGIVNQLVISKKISGHIILSTSSGYQTIQLPMKDEDIDKIQAQPSGEGLNRTMENTVKILQSADYVFTLTDGELSDEPINRKAFKIKGINPIGLYIGERKPLHLWFDKYVNRKTIEALIDELIRTIK